MPLSLESVSLLHASAIRPSDSSCVFSLLYLVGNEYISTRKAHTRRRRRVGCLVDVENE